MRGRKRVNFPAHIDASKVPKKCYWDKSGNGHWFTKYKDNGVWRRKKVADHRATLADLHTALEERQGIATGSFEWLADEFEKSAQFRQNSKSMKKDWDYCKRVVCSMQSRSGVSLGKTNRAKWTTPDIQKIIDRVAVDRGPSSAKHVYTYLKRLFNWGLNRGYCSKNPVQAMELPRERKRQRLPEKDVIARLISFAQERSKLKSRTKGSCKAYIWMALEIGYLNRLRGIESFKATDDQIKEDGLECSRAKGSTDNVTRWNPRLRNVVDAALAHRDELWAKKKRPYPIKPDQRPILVNDYGDAVKASTWQSGWKRFLEMAIRENIITKDQWFGLHDMKRRGATDTPGTKSDKLDATGLSSLQILKTYDKSKQLVDASSE